MAIYSVTHLSTTLIKGKKITYLICVGANPLYAHNSYAAEDSTFYAGDSSYRSTSRERRRLTKASIWYKSNLGKVCLLAEGEMERREVSYKGPGT